MQNNVRCVKDIAIEEGGASETFGGTRDESIRATTARWRGANRGVGAVNVRVLSDAPDGLALDGADRRTGLDHYEVAAGHEVDDANDAIDVLLGAGDRGLRAVDL